MSTYYSNISSYEKPSSITRSQRNDMVRHADTTGYEIVSRDNAVMGVDTTPHTIARSVIPQEILAMADEMDVTYREFMTIVALLQNAPNSFGEIGVRNDGRFMTAVDVARYVRRSDDVVRHAILGLKKKGIIELSRYVVEDDVRKAVYRFVDSSITTAVSECFEEVMQDAMSERN